MTNQDRLAEQIPREIEVLRKEEYTGMLGINFTKGNIANKFLFKISKQILDFNAD